MPHKTRLLLGTLLALGWLFNAIQGVRPVFSQAVPDKALITNIDTNNFPELTAHILVVNQDGAVVPGLTAADFSVKEDDTDLVDLVIESQPVGVQWVIIIDELGIESRIDKVRAVLQGLIEGKMGEGDQVQIVVANGGGRRILIPFTTDKTALLKAIQPDKYAPVGLNNTELLKAVSDSLSDLQTKDDLGLYKTVVIFSAGVSNQQPLKDTIAAAQRVRIPLHTITISGQDLNGSLQSLAAGTKAGDLINISNAEALGRKFDAIEKQSAQYVLNYRSKVATPGDHALSVAVSKVPAVKRTFPIEALEPPLVTFIVTGLESGATIQRTQTEFGQDSGLVEPASQSVAIQVEFPDGHPRNLVSTRFFIENGEDQGVSGEIEANGQELIEQVLTWDLRPFDAPGENPVRLVAEAVDELGLTGRSEAVDVIVDFVSAPPPVVNRVLCEAVGRVSEGGKTFCNDSYEYFLALLATIPAVIALVIVWRRPVVREYMSSGYTRVTEAAQDFIDSVTKRTKPGSAAKAYLIGIEGVDGSRNTFEIYGTTPIGRSRRNAELLFHANREESAVSRLHCTILEEDEGVFKIRDEGSANGTFLNDERLPELEPRPLNDGDEIELGPVERGGVKLRFQLTTSRSGPRVAHSMDGEDGQTVRVSRKKDHSYPPTELN